MMNITYYIFLSCLHFALSKSGLGLGVCSRDPLRCCPNYRLDHRVCEPCPIGTYGDNCSGGRCPDGSYGFGCSKACSCSRDQFCDAVTGCSNKDSDDDQKWERLRQREERRMEQYQEMLFKEKDTILERIKSVHVSIIISSFAGAVLLVAIILFILATRKRVTNITTHGFYLGESRPAPETTFQSYMRVEENTYNEPDLVSLDYIIPVDSDKNYYNTNIHESLSEKREDMKNGKSSILSILMRKSKDSEFNEMDMGYIDVTEAGSGTDSLPPSPPLTLNTTTACSMTTSTLQLQTKRKLTEPSPRRPAVENGINQLTTAVPIKTKLASHQPVALETNTMTQPTVVSANTITSPLKLAIKAQPSTSLAMNVSSPFTIQTEVTTQSHTVKSGTKLTSVSLMKLQPNTVSQLIKPTKSARLHETRTRTNVKPKTCLQSQPGTTGQPITPLTTRETNSKGIQRIIDFYETVQSKN